MTDGDELSEEANERIFREQIVPMFLTGAPSQDRPVVVIVGSQTGGGKTQITRMVKQALGQHGSFININMDFYNPLHPKYHQWRAQDESTASAKVRPDGERWWEKAQAYAIEHRCHVVLESAMFHRSEFEDIARRFNAGGFQVEAALVAVPASLSRLGILDRYWSEVREVGHGRLIDPAIHDACYAGVERGAAAIDEGTLAHSAFVFRRNGEVVYANHLTADGSWAAPPRMAAAVTDERHRPWTASEQAWFSGRITALRADISVGWHVEVDRIQALATPLMSPVGRAQAAQLRSATAPRHDLRRTSSPQPALPPGRSPHPTIKPTGRNAHGR
ncbi:zeta toxin family protein [Streptosporangium canum]|uniref:zeta toxin family protein n=1 Tax=Streptosporangium canum TaxID=324952 RepID=UPI0036AA0C12